MLSGTGGWNLRFSNRVSLSSSVFSAFVVSTAWVTLLYVVGLAMVWDLGCTSIGRTGPESLALEGAANARSGSKEGTEIRRPQGLRPPVRKRAA